MATKRRFLAVADEAVMAIVRTHYRYKRPPRKRKAVALDVPVIVRAAASSKPVPHQDSAVTASANDARKSAIATSISRKRTRFLAQPAAVNDTDEATTAWTRAVIARLLNK